MRKGRLTSINLTPDGQKFPVTNIEKMQVTNATENLTVKIDTIDHVTGKEKEMCSICISHSDGFQWVGTIQDFKAIFAVLRNAKALVNSFDEKEYEDKSVVVGEIDHLLTHLK